MATAGRISSLRRGNEVIFSSLAKLNVIAKPEGKCMNLWVNGQPRVNMKYRSPLPALKVNGSNVNPQRQDGMMDQGAFAKAQAGNKRT